MATKFNVEACVRLENGHIVPTSAFIDEPPASPIMGFALRVQGQDVFDLPDGREGLPLGGHIIDELEKARTVHDVYGFIRFALTYWDRRCEFVTLDDFRRTCTVTVNWKSDDFRYWMDTVTRFDADYLSCYGVGVSSDALYNVCWYTSREGENTETDFVKTAREMLAGYLAQYRDIWLFDPDEAGEDIVTYYFCKEDK